MLLFKHRCWILYVWKYRIQQLTSSLILREKWRKYLCDWTGSLNFMFYAPCYVWLDGCLKWPFIFIDFLFPLSTLPQYQGIFVSFIFIWMNHYLLIQKKEKKENELRVLQLVSYTWTSSIPTGCSFSTC